MKRFVGALLVLTSSLVAILPGCDLFGGDDEAGVTVAWSLGRTPTLTDFVTRPLIEGDRAFISYDDQIALHDAATGERLWSRPLQNGAGGPGLSSRALVSDGGRDGALYLNDANWVAALDKRSGEVRWAHVLGSVRTVARGIMAQDATSLYLPARGEVVQISKSDGAVLQRYGLGAHAETGVDELPGDLSVRDGTLCAPTAFFSLDRIKKSGAVYCFDTETGEMLWSTALPAKRYFFEGLQDSVWAQTDATGAVIAGDRVAVSTNAQVLALDRADGSILWEQFIPEEAGFWVGPTVEDGAVYVGGTTQRVHKFDLATGALEWTHVMDGSLQPLITVEDGQVFFTNNGWGEVWVLDDWTGRPIWHGRPPAYERTGELFLSPVAVGEEHMVVVGDQGVYGLTRP